MCILNRLKPDLDTAVIVLCPRVKELALQNWETSRILLGLSKDTKNNQRNLVTDNCVTISEVNSKNKKEA